jgi:hypothetical protein
MSQKKPEPARFYAFGKRSRKIKQTPTISPFFEGRKPDFVGLGCRLPKSEQCRARAPGSAASFKSAVIWKESSPASGSSVGAPLSPRGAGGGGAPASGAARQKFCQIFAFSPCPRRGPRAADVFKKDIAYFDKMVYKLKAKAKSASRKVLATGGRPSTKALFSIHQPK